MRRIVLKTKPYPAEQIPEMLKEHGVCINRFAEEYIAHPRFSAGQTGELTVIITSLREIGLENGATLEEIYRHIPQVGLQPCPSDTGVFLRLEWKDQPQSSNSILSGTHGAPDQAVTVFSEILEQNDDLPKGLYLRNVDGVLWLRGYTCDASYRFPGDALFAFEECGNMTFYCEHCSMPFVGSRCPICRRKSTRSIEPDDICFLTEKEQIWSGMLAEVLTQKGIPFIQKSTMGAGMALRVGSMFEHERFYVFYRHLDEAREIVEELFSLSDIESDADDEAEQNA